MARAMREGTLGEPPAPLPSHPSNCGGGGGGGAPPQRGPLPIPIPIPPSPSPDTRLSCRGGGDPPGSPPSLGGYGWGRHGDFPPTEDPENLGTPRIEGGVAPNGLLAGPPPPNPEQILGARLRLLGDAFQHSHERQRRGVFWLFRWVAPWLGAAPAAPLAARGGN